MILFIKIIMFIIYLYRNIINGSIFVHNGINFIEFNKNFLYFKNINNLSIFEYIKKDDIYKVIGYFDINFILFTDIINNIFINNSNIYDYESGYNLYYKDIIEFGIEQSLIYKLLYINKLYNKNLLHLNNNILDKIYTKVLLKYKLNKLIIKKIKNSLHRNNNKF